jgi:hypothetical protein
VAKNYTIEIPELWLIRWKKYKRKTWDLPLRWSATMIKPDEAQSHYKKSVQENVDDSIVFYQCPQGREKMIGNRFNLYGANDNLVCGEGRGSQTCGPWKLM